MSARRCLVVFMLAGWILAGFGTLSLLAQTPEMWPTAAAAQPSAPSGAPAAYPSTSSAATSYPTTSYPSTASAAGPAFVGSFAGPTDEAMTGVIPSSLGMTGGIGGTQLSSGANDPAPTSIPYATVEPSFRSPFSEPNAQIDRSFVGDECWTWQLLPTGIMYKPDFANQRQPRMAVQLVHERDLGWFWEPTLGGHAGIVRYGTDNEFWPEGWQLDIEGAAYPRLDGDRNMVSTDFTFGIPLTMREGPWEFKFGYNHLSSHLGDLFMLANPGYPRINYVRESLVLGLACYPTPSLRIFEETGWAFHTDGGAEPWEFRFGADFCTPEPTGPFGAPFCAICAHLRQENDFGGNLDVQTGWMWRGYTGHTIRVGMQYFNGMSEQAQFFKKFEEQIGAGVWYDF